MNAIAAYAREMKDFLEESELTERRAFIETFVKEILVVPGDASCVTPFPCPTIAGRRERPPTRWPFPMPFYLPCTMVGRTGRNQDRGRFRRHPVRRHGDGVRQTASSSTISMPCTKMRIRAFRSGNVPSIRNSRKSATYPLISLLVGNSTRRCSSWPSASSRAAVSWSWRALQDRIRGDSASMGNCLVSSAW